MAADIMTTPVLQSSPMELVGDDQIYISSATLQIKPYTNATTTIATTTTKEDLIEYEWRTEVVAKNVETIPPTESEIVAKRVPGQQQQQSQKSQPITTEERKKNKNLFTPAFIYDEKDNISTTLRKFMDAERYNSEYNWILNHSLVYRGDSTKVLTKV